VNAQAKTANANVLALTWHEVRGREVVLLLGKLLMIGGNPLCPDLADALARLDSITSIGRTADVLPWLHVRANNKTIVTRFWLQATQRLMPRKAA
jgi:hypothetical protein